MSPLKEVTQRSPEGLMRFFNIHRRYICEAPPDPHPCQQTAMMICTKCFALLCSYHAGIHFKVCPKLEQPGKGSPLPPPQPVTK